MKKMFKNNLGVSNNTIAILIIVSLFISIVGTWLILESFQSRYVTAQVSSKTQQSGLVQLDIVGPTVQKSTGTVGMVTLDING